MQIKVQFARHGTQKVLIKNIGPEFDNQENQEFDSLRASSPIWASEASLARTRVREAQLTQIGELARRLPV